MSNYFNHMESSIQFARLRTFVYYIFIILRIYGGYEDSHVTCTLNSISCVTILEEKTSNLTVLCLSVKYTHHIFIVGLINCHVLSLCQPLILNYKQPTLTIRKNTPGLSPALQVCTTWHQRKFSLHWTATLSLLYNIGKEIADYTRLKIRARGCSKFIFSCTVTPQLVSRSETLTKTMTYSEKLIDRESSPLEFVRCKDGAFCFLQVGCSNLKCT